MRKGVESSMQTTTERDARNAAGCPDSIDRDEQVASVRDLSLPSDHATEEQR